MISLMKNFEIIGETRPFRAEGGDRRQRLGRLLAEALRGGPPGGDHQLP